MGHFLGNWRDTILVTDGTHYSSLQFYGSEMKIKYKYVDMYKTIGHDEKSHL